MSLVTRWGVVADNAIRVLDTDDAAAGKLAELCLAADTLMPEYSMRPRPGGAPSGRPLVDVVRLAAHHLIASTRDSRDRTDLYRRAVGLVFSTWQPQISRPAPDPYTDLHTRNEQCNQATEIARGLDDDTMLSWCLCHRGSSEHQITAWSRAILTLQETAALALRGPGESARSSMAACITVGPFAATEAVWAETVTIQRLKIACRALHLVTMAAGPLGDFDLWESALCRLVTTAESLAGTHPHVLARALNRAGALARARGDFDEYRAIERRLREWAEQSGQNAVTRVWLSEAARNAEQLRDFGRAYILNRQYVDLALENVTDAPPTGSPPGAYLPVVAALERNGQRSRRIAVGNGAYRTAFQLWSSRWTAASIETWQEIEEWLNLATRTWKTDGRNGLMAVELMRARLLAEHPTHPDPLRAADAALHVSSDALRLGLRENAVQAAAEWCKPGDRRVLARLDEFLTRAAPSRVSKLRAARALWYQRLAEHVELSGGNTETIAEAWRHAEDDALAAARGLKVNGVLVDPMRVAQAWAIAATACGRGGRHVANIAMTRLSRLLQAIQSLTELLVTVSQMTDRLRFAQFFGTVFDQAAQLAVELGDVAAADTIMEAVRRDRVGALITDLANRHDASEQVRIAAERVIAANTAKPSVNGFGLGTTEMAHVAQHRTLTRIADAIKDRRARSVRQADEVLGIIGALADGRGLPEISAAEVLQLRSRAAGPAAILQLLPTNLPLLDSGGRPLQLYRRLTLRDDSGKTEEFLDSVTLSFDPTGLAPDSIRYWPSLGRLTKQLLPMPLRRLLGVHGPHAPLRLIVIPTGLFDVAFDALPLDHERQLIDAATITVHPSLTTTKYLLTSISTTADGQPIAVYDTERLQHTTQELKSLCANFYHVDRITGRAELLDRMSPASGSRHQLLAMAVHGVDDPNDGWGQIKLLPDGSSLAAAEAMGLSFPPVCVLASCHSSIRVRNGIELAGFPLALFARGATTVIGSLCEIEDRSTSQIMELFWEHLSRYADPVRALREAKLAWIAQAPDRRLKPRQWAGLVALGGAHL